MVYKVRDRKGNESIIKESNSIRFFYGTVLGRVSVKIISFPVFSKIIGWFLSTRLSKFMVRSFVKKNNINLSEFEKNEYDSFNDLFTRKRKNLTFNKNEEVFISPADAKLMCYSINSDDKFKIKNSYYSVSDLVNGDLIYKKYIGGYALIFRLSPDDYHRYVYLDSGVKGKNTFIPGFLNTVRPIVLDYINIYKRNSREYTIMDTDNFGCVTQIEVGALLVGKINNFHQKYNFKKGEEKGMFEFGGSTIVLLIEKDKVILDEDILNNSKENIETIVKCGSKIGKKF